MRREPGNGQRIKHNSEAMKLFRACQNTGRLLKGIFADAKSDALTARDSSRLNSGATWLLEICLANAVSGLTSFITHSAMGAPSLGKYTICTSGLLLKRSRCTRLNVRPAALKSGMRNARPSSWRISLTVLMDRSVSLLTLATVSRE